MSKFNPYQTWFGLDTSTKPTYYALLGLRDFETEPPVIAEAAECRLQLLETHKTGVHAEFAAKLSREVTGVMNVLLSPDKRKQYDDKLREQRGGGAAAARPSVSLEAMLPPAVAASDSPTAMLPPGSFQLPPQSPPPHQQFPAGPAYGAFPPAAPAAPYGQFAPGQPMMAQPPMGMPPYAAAPSSADPYAAFPAAAPAYAAPAMPGYGAPNPTDMYGPAAVAAPPATVGGAMYATSNVSHRTRLAGYRRQKSSPIMLALLLLGGGAGLLTIVMLVVAALNKPKGTPAPQQNVAVVAPPKLSSEDLMRIQAEQARRQTQANYAAGHATGPSEAERAVGSAIAKAFTADAVMNEPPPAASPTGTPQPGQLPSMDQLVISMAPKTAVATPGFPPPSPSFDAPTSPPAAMPSATGSSPAVPSIAGLDPSKMPMEAALPADEARAKSVNTMLGAARKMLRSRDYAKAEEIILQTQVLADTPELITSTQSHGRLLELLQTFWTAAHEGVKSLKEGDEITNDGKTLKVVKHDDLNLVVKGSDNKEIVLVIDKLLPGLAVQMAERTLPKDDATTKLATAALLGLDQGGDRAKSASLLVEAEAMGSDVTALKAVLEAAP